MSRNKAALIALTALAVVIGTWLLTRSHPSDPESPTAVEPTGSKCPIATLPPEVRDTVLRIHSGGPFLFPRSDGEVFANREGHLPKQRRGFYHEYTVITPRSRDRSMRRIVTGGTPLTDPTQYFYTGNHYDSFCVLTDAGRQ
jgi:ribonuclease T1